MRHSLYAYKIRVSINAIAENISAYLEGFYADNVCPAGLVIGRPKRSTQPFTRERKASSTLKTWV